MPSLPGHAKKLASFSHILELEIAGTAGFLLLT
jgi:hypothetical protein